MTAPVTCNSSQPLGCPPFLPKPFTSINSLTGSLLSSAFAALLFPRLCCCATSSFHLGCSAATSGDADAVNRRMQDLQCGTIKGRNEEDIAWERAFSRSEWYARCNC